jgi:hypothetical protein
LIIFLASEIGVKPLFWKGLEERELRVQIPPPDPVSQSASRAIPVSTKLDAKH